MNHPVVITEPHLGPGQQGGVRHVELVAGVSQSLAPGRGLLHPLGRQAGVKPPTEPGTTPLHFLDFQLDLHTHWTQCTIYRANDLSYSLVLHVPLTLSVADHDNLVS